jgi:RimJ/RimL family protein N-acetyltransferase
MTGPLIHLEPLTTEGQRIVSTWLPDERAMLQWAGPTFRHPLNEDQWRDHLAPGLRTPPLLLAYEGRDMESGRMMAYGEIAQINYQAPSAVLCRLMVDPGSRGRGLGLALVEALAHKGFGELGFHRLELRVYDFNQAAIRCYERAGFVKEGRLRETTRFGTEYWDAWVMSRLATEEPEKNG